MAEAGLAVGLQRQVALLRTEDQNKVMSLSCIFDSLDSLKLFRCQCQWQWQLFAG